jgi:glyoxylase-like metal-dependent hydrolase (beta-lactamase superfamily II)
MTTSADDLVNFKLGAFQLQSVSGGRLWLDGGSMFGVVPKALWQRKSQFDQQNRIPLDTNCLLVRTGRANVLIDTGYGSKWGERERANYALEDGQPLLDSLAGVGLAPRDVDGVILTHLHFDHAGGCTRLDETQRLRPTFPRARYVIQRREWEDATANLPELAGSYFEQDFLALGQAGQLHLVDGEAEPWPGISVRLAGGHTRGHQIVILESAGQHAAYLGDLCPTAAHLKTFWTLAYDQFPREVRRVKPALLREMADNGWLLVFDHDPRVRAAYLGRGKEEEVVIREVVPL